MKKNKILIPTIVALSSTATIASITAASISYSMNNSNDAKINSSITANAAYSTITYNTDDDVTLQGPIKARIRTNHVFGSASKPIATHSSGVAFLGWSTTKGDIATIISNDTPVTSNLSVYPVFRYNLTLNPNGGTFKDGSTTNKDIAVDDNNKVSQPGDPFRIGYLFNGWYTTQECTAGTEFSFSQKITKATTIYACWNSTTYSATLISGAGKFKTSEGTFTRLEYSNIPGGSTIQELLTSKGITVISDTAEISYTSNWTTTGSDVLPASTTKITPNMVAYPLYDTNGYAPKLTEYPTAVGVKILQSGKFYLSNNGTNAPDLKYSTDIGVTWTDAPTSSENAISLEKGTNLYLKGNNTSGFSTSTSNYSTINISGKYNVSGSVMGLLDDGGKSSTISNIPCNYCFYGLFKDSIGLNKVKSDFLPATTLSSYSYASMFYGCACLRVAPNLPATYAYPYCYNEMFSGCACLTSCPTMNFTKCGMYSSDKMFQNCTNLESTPSFENVTSINSYCFQYMFDGCTSLKTVQNLPTLSANSAFGNMFSNCTNLTTIPSTLGSETLALRQNCYQYMFQNCTSLTTAPTILAKSLSTNSCEYMFDGCTSLTTVQNLPALSAYSAFGYMFRNCTNLTTVPSTLGSETLALQQNCYQYMFQNCTSLTTAPTILAKSLSIGSCLYMFQGCTSLTTVQESMPNVAKVYAACYAYMFDGCTSLQSAPNLPSTTLEFRPGSGDQYLGCYSYMFQNCTSLIKAPIISATTITGTVSSAYATSGVCYYMFAGCTSLTTAPALNITTLYPYSYSNMFAGCTSLSTITALSATTLAQSCYAYMFKQCTSLATAPALPVTTAAQSCYAYMFNGCINLTTPPIIGLTTFVKYCCSNMFNGCSKLYVTAGSGTTQFFTSDSSGSATYFDSMFKNVSDGSGGTTTITVAASTSYFFN